LSYEIGGELALERAIRSHELASVRFSSGAWAIGVLADRSPGPLSWLRFEGPVAFAEDGLIPSVELERTSDAVVLLGTLADGRALDRADGVALDAYRVGADRHRFEFFLGPVVEGRLERSARGRRGRLLWLELSDVRIAFGDRTALELPSYRLLAAGNPISAQAGAVDPSFHGETAFPSVRVPKPRVLPPREQSLSVLYERAAEAHARGAVAMTHEFPRVHEELVRAFPDEWLLRWNLLESLLKVGERGALSTELRAELERLEVAFDYRQPIASGLRYLAKLAA
jgi:hypothetical protein